MVLITYKYKIRFFSVLDELNVKFSKLSTTLDGQFLLKLTFSAPISEAVLHVVLVVSCICCLLKH